MKRSSSYDSFTDMRAVIGLLALVTIAACHGAAAANFPSRQLTYLVSFDPGGQSDREARRQQPLLERYLGRKVVVDYKAGGSGALGWSEVAHSRPDGYLFVGINIPHIILQPLLQDTGYETAQLQPVAIFQRTPVGLAVAANSPFRTLDDFVKAATARPGTISIGGSGSLTAPHMAALRLNRLTGAKITYVPFSGSAPAITAFLGGHTVANFAFSDDLVRFRDRIRILAIATEARFAGFPDVPTFRELGIDLVESVERGVAVPRGTPEASCRDSKLPFSRSRTTPPSSSLKRAKGSCRWRCRAVKPEPTSTRKRNTTERSCKSSDKIDADVTDWRTLRAADLAVSAVLILSGVAALVSVRQMRVGFVAEFQPRLFPAVIGLLLIVVGALAAVTAWRSPPRVLAEWPAPDRAKRIAVILVSVAAYVAVINLVGMPLATFMVVSFEVWYSAATAGTCRSRLECALPRFFTSCSWSAWA